MAKKPPEKSELSCSPRLFSILESQQGLATHKMISNGRRPVKKHIVDHQRNVDQLPRFDQECRKVQNEANSAKVSVSTSARNDGNLIENHQDKQISELIDYSLKMQTRVRKTSQNAYQSTSCYSNNTASLIHPRKYDHLAGEIKMRQVQMSAKAFVDQMFVDRMLIRKEEVMSSESQPFSSALDNLFVENLRKNKTRTNFKSQPSNKIIIVKPVTPKNAENVTCHCSSLQPRRKSAEKVPKAKITSFSFRQLKSKLKHTFGVARNEQKHGVDMENSFVLSTNAKRKEKLGKKKLKSRTGPDGDTVRRISDLSSVKFPNKQNFNVVLEAKKHLSARFEKLKDAETLSCKRSPKTVRHILFSPEHDSQSSCEMPNRRQSTSLEVISSSDYEELEGGLKIVEMNSRKHLNETIEFHHEDGGNVKHSASPLQDSILENETFTTADNFQSPPCSIYPLDVADSVKYREEHQSPVSVLEPFFAEDDNSPTSITLQSGTQPLQPLRLDFEECSFESHPQDPVISTNTCIDAQDYIFCYVHLVLQASCLDWNQLSEIISQPEELLHASLFDEVEFLRSSDDFFDYKLLFDHMDEVLLHMHQRYFSSTSKPAFLKPEIRSKPLEKLVFDEILGEADFYLLPRTEKRTLDQLVSKDVAGSRSWVKLRQETEEIVNDISEDVLEEWILDIVLELST